MVTREEISQATQRYAEKIKRMQEFNEEAKREELE